MDQVHSSALGNDSLPITMSCISYITSCILYPQAIFSLVACTIPYMGMGYRGDSGGSYTDRQREPPHLRCGPCGAGRRGTSGGTSPPSPPPGHTRSSPGPTLPGVKGHAAGLTEDNDSDNEAEVSWTGPGSPGHSCRLSG